MCGIFGFTGLKSEKTLQEMGQTLLHRGPDEDGFYTDEKVSLGMRRLSIVDLKTGKQPARSQNGQIIGFLNGEIYNHIELRQELVTQGFKFKTQNSDSEVIPHLYERDGIDFINKLNGMFGIAIWDTRTQELHLIRDHCGIKPVYYSVVNDQIIYSSEIKAILVHPDVKKRPNAKAISDYFTFKNVNAPLSAFEGIYQLKAGERLVFKKGHITKHKWFIPTFIDNPKMTEVEAKKTIRDLLEDSVRLQMRADVDVGSYLSGGIDSSAVTALASRLTDRPLKTFTLVYEDQGEGKVADQKFAKLISDQYKTDHYEHVMTAQDIPDGMDKIIESFDEPFSGTVSTFFLSKLIKKHVKVALSGDGADELFGSYLPHRLAAPIDNLISAHAMGETPNSVNLKPFQDKIEYLENLLNFKTETERRMEQYIWQDYRKPELFSKKFLNEVMGYKSSDQIERLYDEAPTRDPLNRALYIDFHTMLPNQILPFVDRLSMAHSIEVRPPFLDPRIVNFAMTIPGHLKIHEGRVKHILKEAVSDLLPSEILNRPKEGFVIPMNTWIIGKLKNYVQDLLSDEQLDKHGYLNNKFVHQILEDHYSNKSDHGYRIWNLMMFQVWWNKYFAR